MFLLITQWFIFKNSGYITAATLRAARKHVANQAIFGFCVLKYFGSTIIHFTINSLFLFNILSTCSTSNTLDPQVLETHNFGLMLWVNRLAETHTDPGIAFEFEIPMVQIQVTTMHSCSALMSLDHGFPTLLFPYCSMNIYPININQPDSESY